MYILEGGYSAFFKSNPTRCFPMSYVEMGAKEHEVACELGLSRIKKRSKIGRAATFGVFGRPAAAGEPQSPERKVTL
jgi:M-phase inducer tyrosine phosphatase